MNNYKKVIPEKVLVVGIGNTFRSDDGIGIAAIEKLRATSSSIDAVYGANDPLALLAQWDGHDSVIVVDAVVTGAPAGTIHRIDLTTCDVPRVARGSTHGAALADAVALATTIDRLPRRLVLLGVEPGETGNGEALSQICRDAMEKLVIEIMGEVNCTKVP